jgi:hypothetical protein
VSDFIDHCDKFERKEFKKGKTSVGSIYSFASSSEVSDDNNSLKESMFIKLNIDVVLLDGSKIFKKFLENNVNSDIYDFVKE